VAFAVETTPHGDRVTVTLHGEITWDQIEQARDALWTLANQQSHTHEIEIDLTDVSYLDEDGVAILLGLIQKARSCGIHLHLIGATGRVAERLKRAGVYYLLDRTLVPA
jgi:anti-anti-sigma factor